MVLVRPSGSGKTTALRMVTDLGGHHLRDALDGREGGQQPAPQGPQGGQRLGTSDSWEHGFHQDFPIPTRLPSPRRYDRDMPYLTRKPCNKHARDQECGAEPRSGRSPEVQLSISSGGFGRLDADAVWTSRPQQRSTTMSMACSLRPRVRRRSTGVTRRSLISLESDTRVQGNSSVLPRPPRLTSPRAQDTSEYPTSPGDEAQFPLLASVAPRQGD
jgi:hypothetical protein